MFYFVAPATPPGLTPATWFVFLYFVAGYFARYGWPWSSRTLSRVALALTALLFVAVALGPRLVPGALAVSDVATALSDYSSPLVAPLAVTLTLWAFTSSPRYSPAINRVATASFGVYLIHHNPLVRDWLWHDLLHTRDVASSPWLAVHAVGSTIAVYVVCTGIELARGRLVQPRAEAVAVRLTDGFLGLASRVWLPWLRGVLQPRASSGSIV